VVLTGFNAQSQGTELMLEQLVCLEKIWSNWSSIVYAMGLWSVAMVGVPMITGYCKRV